MSAPTLSDVDTSVLLDQLDALTAELLRRTHTRASHEELLAGWVRVERHRAQWDAVETRLVAEIDSRGVAQGRNLRSTVTLARVALRLSPGEARARVAAARALAPRVMLTGEVVDPEYPQVAAALAAGVISARQAVSIAEAIDKIPAEFRDDVHDSVEQHLVQTAGQIDALRLAQHAADLVGALNPDGQLTDYARRERLRELHLRIRPDGSARIEGELSIEATEYLRTALDPLTRPAPAIDGVKDARTPGQRRHDALLALTKAALRAGQLPATAGITTTVLLTTHAHDWNQSEGVAVTGHGTRVPVKKARDWASSDYRTMLITFDQQGGIDGWTDSRRLFTESQRLALIARDRGCTAPDCDAPASHCEAHHVDEHTDGGPTTIENGALLCDFNHAHYKELGWRCVMLNGRPHWIPPKWMDPDQTPRCNTMHDY